MENFIFENWNWQQIIFISTPIISLLAVLIYWRALNSSLKQNKITLSASLIPYYEEEINELKEEGVKIKLNYKESYTITVYNALNYFTPLIHSIKNLQANEEYVKDLKDGRFNAGIIEQDLEEKSYKEELKFVLNFFNAETPFRNFIYRIEYLVDNVENSGLTTAHRYILKRKIRRILGVEHFKLLYYSNLYPSKIQCEIPINTHLDYDGMEYLLIEEFKDTPLFGDLRRLDKKLTLN